VGITVTGITVTAHLIKITNIVALLLLAILAH
jgi:hypothetical protein